MNCNFGFGMENVGGSGRERGDDDYYLVLKYIVEPIVSQFKPELILVYSGFDAANGDPVGRMKVTPAGFSQFVSFANSMAAKYSNGKIIFETGGGYSSTSFYASLEASLRAWVNTKENQTWSSWSEEGSQANINTYKEIQNFIQTHSNLWPTLMAGLSYISSKLNQLNELIEREICTLSLSQAQRVQQVWRDIGEFNKLGIHFDDERFKDFVGKIWEKLTAGNQRTLSHKLSYRLVDTLFVGMNRSFFVDKFLIFMERNDVSFSKDTFAMFYKFLVTFKNDYDLHTWSEDDYWPCLLDDFVDSLRLGDL
eukprot:TRINITY_DN6025_c0_g1_i10.p1 TRINITY_DN6025_c0_g1~~TRINITY_DN6025_c0_g1_i10.p1  ORF type:complete len:309 (-),score=74.32 TRINITY_DN6025_c0_g1_i10:43-969(-)